MTSAASAELLERLRSIVGRRHVLTGSSTGSYDQGYRIGITPATAVVRPGSLVELWRAFKACVEADHVVIPQAANTGLTGGSTPTGGYDRPAVVVSTLRIGGVRTILGGRQAVCLPGATLHDLERELAPLGREPHSVIGSSCIGASVVGGVCNNSGGALVQRGPAYTEYALYAQVDDDGSVHLRNELGIALGDDPEEALARLERGGYREGDITCDHRLASSASHYAEAVRRVDDATPARFNADPSRLHGASGSAGKVLVFAVRLDTFERPSGTAVLYVGTNDPDELTRLRRSILTSSDPLPISGEYVHREAFDVADHYGKDTVLAIRWLGTDRLPALFRLRNWVDGLARSSRLLPRHPADRLLQSASRIAGDHLPRRMRDFRDRYEHHLILKVAAADIESTRRRLRAILHSPSGDFFECTDEEADRAMLHRFAVAGAAVRYRAVHQDDVEDIAAIDVALRRDDADWFERLPPELEAQVVTKLYYGHFLCHVFHQDYVVRKGVDPVAFEHAVHRLLDARGAKYPAEHNVGHLYQAEDALAEHYRGLDPGNRMNPGIGLSSKKRRYA